MKNAVPLPSIDIALSALPGKTLAPSLAPEPKAKSKPVTKPDSAPPRRSARKKIPTRPRQFAPEVGNPPPSSTPTISTQPSQEPVVPPPPEETQAPDATADYLRNPSPEYPSAARSRRWEGEVLLRVFVNADGNCGEASVQASSGHGVLDQAALEAVKHWRFVPAKRGDRAVSSWVAVPISFKLDS